MSLSKSAAANTWIARALKERACAAITRQHDNENLDFICQNVASDVLEGSFIDDPDKVLASFEDWVDGWLCWVVYHSMLPGEFRANPVARGVLKHPPLRPLRQKARSRDEDEDDDIEDEDDELPEAKPRKAAARKKAPAKKASRKKGGRA